MISDDWKINRKNRKKNIIALSIKTTRILRQNNDFVNHTKALNNTTFKYSSIIN